MCEREIYRQREKKKNIKYTASQYTATYHDLHEYTRTLLHSLVENYISGIIQFITYSKKVMVEEAEKKGIQN